MAFDFITAGIELFDNILKKVIPDANLRAETARDLATQSNNLIMVQVEVNKIEASSQNLFIAGWRPGIGWTCGAAFAWQFVLQPFVTYILLVSGVAIPPMPQLDWSQLSIVMTGMLGLGAMRSFDKQAK